MLCRYRIRQKAIPKILMQCAEEGIIVLKFRDSLGSLGATLKVKDKDSEYRERFVEEIEIFESRRDEFNTRLVYYLQESPGSKCFFPC